MNSISTGANDVSHAVGYCRLACSVGPLVHLMDSESGSVCFCCCVDVRCMCCSPEESIECIVFAVGCSTTAEDVGRSTVATVAVTSLCIAWGLWTLSKCAWSAFQNARVKTNFTRTS